MNRDNPNRGAKAPRWAIAACTVALLASGAVSAQEKFFGDHEFRTSCAVCHGTGGKGDGPLAKSITPPPTDLTTLSKNNKGEFPYERVFEMIDGRGALAAHGSGDMPIWGDRYSLEVKQAIVRARILELAYYLRSIQAK